MSDNKIKKQNRSLKQHLRDVKGVYNFKTVEDSLDPYRLKSRQGRLGLQNMINPRSKEPFVKATTVNQQILQDLIRIQNKGDRNMRFKLEHATRNALMQTFRHLGVADVQDLMRNEGLLEVDGLPSVGSGELVQKLENLSQRMGRTSLMKNVRSQVAMVDDLDVKRLTTEYSFAPEEVLDITNRSTHKGHATKLHARVSELVGKNFPDKFDVSTGFSIKEIAGAPVMQFGISKATGADRARRTMQIPLTSSVPVSSLASNIFGEVDTLERQGAKGRLLNFGEFIIEDLVNKNGLLAKWDAGLHHFKAEGKDNLKDMRKLYGDFFPQAMPAGPETGVSGVWETMRSSRVNIELPKDMAPEDLPAWIEKQVARPGIFYSPKGEIIRTEGGRQFYPFQRGVDLTKLVPFGEETRWARKPLHIIRPETTLTSDAVQSVRMFEKARGIRKTVTAEAAIQMANIRDLNMPMLYMPDMMDLGVREGEIAVSDTITEMLNTQSTRKYRILESSGILPLAPEIVEAQATGKPVRLAAGARLGMGRELLKTTTAAGEVVYGGKTSDLDELISQTVGDDITDIIKSVKKASGTDYVTVEIERQVRGGVAQKVFGEGGVKSVLRPQESSMLAKYAQKVSGTGIKPEAFTHYEALFKDPRARKYQMTTGLRHILSQAGVNNAFTDDPLQYLSDVQGQAYGVERKLLALSRKHGLTGVEFGMVFGTYAKEIKEESSAILSGAIDFSEKELEYIKRNPFAFGIAQVVPGGELGAHEMVKGSFETRAIWKAGLGGPTGEGVAEIVGQRRLGKSYGAVTELRKAMLSVAGDANLSKLLTEQQFAGAQELDRSMLRRTSDKTIWSQEGTLLKFTEEQQKTYGLKKHMYLPSITEVTGMGTRPGEAGKREALSTLKRYSELLSAVMTKESAKDVTAAMKNLDIELSTQYARATAGKAKTPGFVYTRVQSQATGFIGPFPSAEAGRWIEREAEVKASRNIMEKMWADSTDKAFVKSQREAFLRGEAVEGLVARHPITGKTGAFPIRLRYDSKLDELGHQLEASESVMKVLRGDYDGDNVIVTTVMNKREQETARKMLKHKTLTATFDDFAKSAAIFSRAKRGAVSGAAAVEFSQLGEQLKMAVTSEIGALDVAFEDILESAAASGDKKIIAGAQQLYENVPQEIISAKHMTPAEAKAMIGESQRIMKAIRGARSPEGIIEGAGQISEAVGKRFDLSKLAEQGIDVEEIVTRSLKARKGSAVKAEDLKAFMHIGRKGPTTAAALRLASDPMRVLRTADAAGGSMHGAMMPDPILSMKSGATGYSAVETLTANVKTMMKGQFAGMGKGTAMVAAATALAGGLFYLGAKSREETPFGGHNIMAPPSRPPRGSAGEMVIPDLNFQAKPKYIHPESIQGGQLKAGQVGSPQAMQHTPKAMVDQNTTPMSSVVRIRGRESANVDYNEISQKIMERMKMPSNVNVNINDNSRTITAEMIDRLIEG